MLRIGSLSRSTPDLSRFEDFSAIERSASRVDALRFALTQDGMMRIRAHVEQHHRAYLRAFLGSAERYRAALSHEARFRSHSDHTKLMSVTHRKVSELCARVEGDGITCRTPICEKARGVEALRHALPSVRAVANPVAFQPGWGPREAVTPMPLLRDLMPVTWQSRVWIPSST